MKKLMIALAAVAMAAGVQAATVNWTCDGAMYTPDAASWTGDLVPEGWGVYFVDSSTYTRDQMITLLGDFNAETFASKVLTWGDAPAKVDHALTGTDGNFESGTTTMAKDAFGKANGYAIIVDAADISKAGYAFITDIYSGVVGDTDMATIVVGDLFDGGYLNAENYADKTNWTKVASAVPEPTSGLLLLLGVAGLALRRRRA